MEATKEGTKMAHPVPSGWKSTEGSKPENHVTKALFFSLHYELEEEAKEYGEVS